AYAAIAAKGDYAQPYAIARIRDRDGHVLYSHQLRTQQTMDPKEAGVLTSSLTGVVDHGTGTAAAIGRPMAGKTGTTENFSDAWFVGYVPQLATAVWVGHPEGNVPMTGVHGIDVAGGTFPAEVFSRMMRKTLAGTPVQPLFSVTPDALALRPFGQVFGGQDANAPGPSGSPTPANPPTPTAPAGSTTTRPATPRQPTTSVQGPAPPPSGPSTTQAPSTTGPTPAPTTTTTPTTRPPSRTTTTR
ncbi:MAG TPA: penicillin-binding transpeptidase domain-containing protein, partial [Acidimicrobiales bacterium]|nr:penicillin-binding transpeptidase domain-containing protein [Acidimicrobiales bacterium]